MVRVPNQIEEEILYNAFSDVLEVFQDRRLTIDQGFSVALATMNYAIKIANNLTQEQYDELSDLIAEASEEIIHTYLEKIDE